MPNELDPNLPINKKLAEKYEVPPMVIAYIRAALLRPDGKYNKESLIFYILEENIERKKEIQKLKFSITEANIDSVKAHILAIQKKLDFRQGVLTVLRALDDDILRDICRIDFQ